jgi:hypothetical protein
MLLTADAAAKYYNGNVSVACNYRRFAMLLTADAQPNTPTATSLLRTIDDWQCC